MVPCAALAGMYALVPSPPAMPNGDMFRRPVMRVAYRVAGRRAPVVMPVPQVSRRWKGRTARKAWAIVVAFPFSAQMLESRVGWIVA